MAIKSFVKYDEKVEGVVEQIVRTLLIGKSLSSSFYVLNVNMNTVTSL